MYSPNTSFSRGRGEGSRFFDGGDTSPEISEIVGVAYCPDATPFFVTAT
jgi:hypothetical protein